MSEKSNPFKGIPSLFSRSSKQDDEARPPASIVENRQTNDGESQSSEQLDSNGRKLIAESKLFDASWYLLKNADVAAAQIEPLEHYVTCGEKEGRNPGPHFDVAWYEKKYPEFSATGFGALEHYLRHGRLENKSTCMADYRAMLENDARLSRENDALKRAPLKFYASPPLSRRINLVVELMSLKHSSVEGVDERNDIDKAIERGLQVAVSLAVATNSSLRVVTRVARARVSGFKQFLLEKNLQPPAYVQFVHCDYVSAQTSLQTSRWDIFITVDEASDASIRSSINEKNIFAFAPTAYAQSIVGDDFSAIVSELARSCESVFV